MIIMTNEMHSFILHWMQQQLKRMRSDQIMLLKSKMGCGRGGVEQYAAIHRIAGKQDYG